MNIMTGQSRDKLVIHLNNLHRHVSNGHKNRAFNDAKEIKRIMDHHQMEWEKTIVNKERNQKTNRLNPMIDDELSLENGYPEIMEMVQVCLDNKVGWRGKKKKKGEKDMFDNIADAMDLDDEITSRQFDKLTEFFVNATSGQLERGVVKKKRKKLRA